MHKRYGDSVEFLAVYVREAHPIDGWRMSSNDQVGISIAQPRSKDDRTTIAERCCSTLEITMPLLVDEIDDRVGHAFSGMPDRLYVIDPAGKVVYKGGRGPFGFKASEMEQSLAMLLIDLAVNKKTALGRTRGLNNDAAWSRLPPPVQGAGLSLPAWARVLTDTLPRTTAAMLELDFLQRTQSPLDPKLRGRLRWVAAHANRCVYSEACAMADLRAIGLNDAALKNLAAENFTDLTRAEQLALAFARKMTLEADIVTDEEVTRLIDLYGENHMVAIVLLLAYANFQDRLVLALDLPVEADRARLPNEIRFGNRISRPMAVIPRPPLPQLSEQELREDQVEFLKNAPNGTEPLKFDNSAELTGMAKQKSRPSRIRVPTWEEARAKLPPVYSNTRNVRVRWSLVCLNYQPELATAWFTCLRTFAEESRQDRVLEESIFWVITHTLHCFY